MTHLYGDYEPSAALTSGDAQTLWRRIYGTDEYSARTHWWLDPTSGHLTYHPRR